MRGHRLNKAEKIQDFSFVKTIDEANAIFRAFGNSKVFQYSKLTNDLTEGRKLQSCSVFYLKVNDPKVFELFNSFSYNQIIFSRMVGNTVNSNPFGVKVSKDDLNTAYLMWGGQ